MFKPFKRSRIKLLFARFHTLTLSLNRNEAFQSRSNNSYSLVFRYLSTSPLSFDPPNRVILSRQRAIYTRAWLVPVARRQPRWRHQPHSTVSTIDSYQIEVVFIVRALMLFQSLSLKINILPFYSYFSHPREFGYPLFPRPIKTASSASRDKKTEYCEIHSHI